MRKKVQVRVMDAARGNGRNSYTTIQRDQDDDGLAGDEEHERVGMRRSQGF